MQLDIETQIYYGTEVHVKLRSKIFSAKHSAADISLKKHRLNALDEGEGLLKVDCFHH